MFGKHTNKIKNIIRNGHVTFTLINICGLFSIILFIFSIYIQCNNLITYNIIKIKSVFQNTCNLYIFFSLWKILKTTETTKKKRF